MINKEELIKKSIENLIYEISNLATAIESVNKSIINAPNAMQSWSDTTRNQKEDLLIGLNRQILEKRKSLGLLRSIKISQHDVIQEGSLVLIIEDDTKEYFLIIPGNVGEEINVNGGVVNIISPQSRVAQSLYGHKKGDIIEVRVPVGVLNFKVISVY